MKWKYEIKIDDSVPNNEIHVEQDGKIIKKIINAVLPPENPEVNQLRTALELAAKQMGDDCPAVLCFDFDRCDARGDEGEHCKRQKHNDYHKCWTEYWLVMAAKEIMAKEGDIDDKSD